MPSNNCFHYREAVATNTWSKRFGHQLCISAVHVIYTADATNGDRHLRLQVKDVDGNVVIDFHPNAATTANDVHHIEFLSGQQRDTGFS